MQHEIDIMGNRRGHTVRSGDVARWRGLRSGRRARKAFEVQPGTREGAALIALIALTPAACRSAMPSPGTGDEKPGAERAERSETHPALPAPLLPAVTAQAGLHRQHHLADMVGALQLAMRPFFATLCGLSVEPVSVSRFTIIMAALIVAVAPCWTAMTTQRPSCFRSCRFLGR